MRLVPPQFMTPPLWAPQILAQGLQLAQGWERLSQSRRALNQRDAALGQKAMQWMQEQDRLKRMDSFQQMKFFHDARQDEFMNQYRNSTLGLGKLQEQRLGRQETRLTAADERQARIDEAKLRQMGNIESAFDKFMGGEGYPGTPQLPLPSGTQGAAPGPLIPGALDADGWLDAEAHAYAYEGDPQWDSNSAAAIGHTNSKGGKTKLIEGDSIGLMKSTADKLGLSPDDTVEVKMPDGTTATMKYHDTIPPEYDEDRVDFYTPSGKPKWTGKGVRIRKVGEGPAVPPVPKPPPPGQPAAQPGQPESPQAQLKPPPYYMLPSFSVTQSGGMGMSWKAEEYPQANAMTMKTWEEQAGDLQPGEGIQGKVVVPGAIEGVPSVTHMQKYRSGTTTASGALTDTQRIGYEQKLRTLQADLQKVVKGWDFDSLEQALAEGSPAEIQHLKTLQIQIEELKGVLNQSAGGTAPAGVERTHNKYFGGD